MDSGAQGIRAGADANIENRGAILAGDAGISVQGGAIVTNRGDIEAALQGIAAGADSTLVTHRFRCHRHAG
jgi:hypothetical protein